MYVKILILLFLVSCSSLTTAKDWTPWYRCGVAESDMTWDHCTANLHGPEVHRLGWCYNIRECRHRKTVLNNTRSEERYTLLLCRYGDLECYETNGLFKKVLTNP